MPFGSLFSLPPWSLQRNALRSQVETKLNQILAGRVPRHDESRHHRALVLSHRLSKMKDPVRTAVAPKPDSGLASDVYRKENKAAVKDVNFSRSSSR
jgi:hypothetical protein